MRQGCSSEAGEASPRLARAFGTVRCPAGMARWILGKGTTPWVSRELVRLASWLVGVKIAALKVRCH